MTEVKRGNIIGTLSGIYEFDKSDPLGLSGQQRKSFEKLWYNRANPDDEDFSQRPIPASFKS